MLRPLTPRRRKVIALAGTTAALASSRSLLHNTHASDVRYSILGILSGLVVGGILVAPKRRTC